MPRSRPNAPRRPTEASTFSGQTNNVAAKEKEKASHGPNSNAGGTSPSTRATRKVVAKDATSTNSIANGRAKDDTKTTSDNRGAALKLIDIATAKTTSGSNGNSHIETRGTTNRDSTGPSRWGGPGHEYRDNFGDVARSRSPLPRSRAPPTGLDDRPQRAEPRSKEMVAAKHTLGGDPDVVLLSFFDGLGTACLICDEYCKGQGLRWKCSSCEIDGNLVKLIAQHFPDVVARGDFEKASATSLHDLVQTLDPGGKATVVVAAGPPCHDFSRIRSDAPGHDGPEGSKFSRFAQLVVDLEKRWQHGRAVLLVENVIPQNRADMRKIEKMLDAPAILHDAADFGTISRPRVWWCRVPWQEIAHRAECPLKPRWTTMQGIPRAHFDVVKDDPQSFETDGLSLPRCLAEEQKPLPCLTTPSDDPQGRPAPRSSKGKISSEANQRWRADRQRFAPWHYEAGVMMTDSQGRFVLPPPSVKEQWHHLPRNWTKQLPEHDRHKALANGWHAGAARLIFIMAMFAATPPTSARELNPIGGAALDIAANLWQGRPPLLGPGPGDYDEFDLSHLQDPSEHWCRSRSMPHPDHRDAQMEPGLQQWLSIWSRMRPHLADLRVEVVQQVEQLAIDMEDETPRLVRDPRSARSEGLRRQVSSLLTTITPAAEDLLALRMARRGHLRGAYSRFSTTGSASSRPWLATQVGLSLRQPAGHGRLPRQEPQVRH